MPPKNKSNKSVKEVSAHVHKKAKRKNIPTAELQDFVKDEQDQKSLEVPSVPIYIQEKIHPQVLIEDLRRVGANGNSPDPQTNLFADFNGIEFELDSAKFSIRYII